MNKEWEYYNHALIPTLAPHEVPDTSWMKDRKKWKELANGKYPLFARWTADFDCKEETEWWYIIRTAPFDIDGLNKNGRKHIRQALKKCKVEKLPIEKCLQDLYRVYNEACARYENVNNEIEYKDFVDEYTNLEEKTECWCAFDSTDRMIGYILVTLKHEYVEISVAKFSAKYMNLRVSDALYYTVLDYYLNRVFMKYASSGERSINHITNTQEYKIKTFGFRKAYCKLHIQYRLWMKAVITVLYPFRNVIQKFSKNKLIYQVWCVLRQEEIHRTFK